MRAPNARRPRAFTIVEMLVVVAIIGLLVGVLLPALAGAQKRSLKSRETNGLRQVGVAWNLYANSSNDMVTPGYIEPEVQQRWNVRYQYRNRQQVPPAPSFVVGPTNPDLAGPWTWRLMTYLDYRVDAVNRRIDPSEVDVATSMDLQTATDIALNPSYGYNAFYIGGWWEDTPLVPRPRFFDSTSDLDGNGTFEASVPLVSRSIGSIQRSSDVVTFTSSSMLARGVYRKYDGNLKGWHIVVPPRLGPDQQWSTPEIMSPGADTPGGSNPRPEFLSAGGIDPSSLYVSAIDTPDDGCDDCGVPAPIGRYNRLIATLFADNHTDVHQPGALLDMRHWIDAADRPDFSHE